MKSTFLVHLGATCLGFPMFRSFAQTGPEVWRTLWSPVSIARTALVTFRHSLSVTGLVVIQNLWASFIFFSYQETHRFCCLLCTELDIYIEAWLMVKRSWNYCWSTRICYLVNIVSLHEMYSLYCSCLDKALWCPVGVDIDEFHSPQPVLHLSHVGLAKFCSLKKVYNVLEVHPVSTSHWFLFNIFVKSLNLPVLQLTLWKDGDNCISSTQSPWG